MKRPTTRSTVGHLISIPERCGDRRKCGSAGLNLIARLISEADTSRFNMKDSPRGRYWGILSPPIGTEGMFCKSNFSRAIPLNPNPSPLLMINRAGSPSRLQPNRARCSGSHTRCSAGSRKPYCAVFAAMCSMKTHLPPFGLRTLHAERRSRQ